MITAEDIGEYPLTIDELAPVVLGMNEAADLAITEFITRWEDSAIFPTVLLSLAVQNAILGRAVDMLNDLVRQKQGFQGVEPE